MIIGRVATVSELANALIRIGYDTDFQHDDVRAWHAPSECHGDVELGADRKCVGLFALSGWFVKDFQEQITEQLGDRWLHLNYAGHLILDGCERARYRKFYVAAPDASVYLIDRLTGEVVG
jgi:hypothetical protein